MLKKDLASLAIFSTFVLVAPANAAIQITNTTLSNAVFTTSNIDILQTNVASTTQTGIFTHFGAIGATALTDGQFGALGGNSQFSSALIGGASITYNFTSAMNISDISTYAGWDAYRGGQSYTVSYAAAGDPANFIALASVYNDAQDPRPGRNVSTRAAIINTSGLLATNVSSLRFDFNNDLTFGPAGYRELDVNGTVASVVPEPASWALMIIGFGLVGVQQRRRQTRAIVA